MSSNIPHTAMVLAAGLGTRMRPLTDTCPKPLIEVGGKRLMDRMIDPLIEAGVQRIVVNVHWLADQVEDHVSGIKGVDLIVSDERGEVLETGGPSSWSIQMRSGVRVIRDLSSIWPAHLTQRRWTRSSFSRIRSAAWDMGAPETFSVPRMAASSDAAKTRLPHGPMREYASSNRKHSQASPWSASRLLGEFGGRLSNPDGCMVCHWMISGCMWAIRTP